jgi:hypothetical protein
LLLNLDSLRRLVSEVAFWSNFEVSDSGEILHLTLRDHHD